MQFVAGPCVLSDEDVDSWLLMWMCTKMVAEKDIDQTDLHRF